MPGVGQLRGMMNCKKLTPNSVLRVPSRPSGRGYFPVSSLRVECSDEKVKVHQAAARNGLRQELLAATRPIHLFARGEPEALLFSIHINDWQAVNAERGGDFAAVMDVVFEHTPDDLLARHGGSRFSGLSRRV